MDQRAVKCLSASSYLSFFYLKNRSCVYCTYLSPVIVFSVHKYYWIHSVIRQCDRDRECWPHDNGLILNDMTRHNSLYRVVKEIKLGGLLLSWETTSTQDISTLFVAGPPSEERGKKWIKIKPYHATMEKKGECESVAPLRWSMMFACPQLTEPGYTPT